MLLKKNMLMKLELEVVLLPRILYILRGIPKELSRILDKLKIVVLLVRKGKKKHKTIVEPSEPAIDPNSISISDAETESGNEENEVPNEEKVEEEPENHTKNTKYTKEDFIAKKHGSER